MDIKLERGKSMSTNYFEGYCAEKLSDLFEKYLFVESISVFCRGSKHPTKKIKIKARLKGKDVFVSGKGPLHENALEVAINKLLKQLKKYKTQHYKVHQSSLAL